MRGLGEVSIPGRVSRFIGDPVKGGSTGGRGEGQGWAHRQRDGQCILTASRKLSIDHNINYN